MLNADILRAFRDAPRPLSLTEALQSAGARNVPPSRAMDALAVLQQAQLIDVIAYERAADGRPTGPRRYIAV